MAQLRLNPKELQYVGFTKRVIEETDRESEAVIYEIPDGRGAMFIYDTTSNKTYSWYYNINGALTSIMIPLNIQNIQALYAILEVFFVGFTKLKPVE